MLEHVLDEMHIDWNGPVISRADTLLSVSLDRKFGSRKRWHFKTGSSTFFTSKVGDRKLDGVGLVDNRPSTDKLHHFV